MGMFIEQFHFIRPWWLVAIIPTVVLAYLVYRHKKNQGQWVDYLPKHLASVMIEQGSSQQKNNIALGLFYAWLIAIVALAGPSWQKIEQPLFTLKQAHVIIVDMSLSMYSTDLKPNRLERAKYKLTDLIKSLSEGETALIAFAGDAFVISPMTSDIANLLNLLPALNPTIMPAYGSRPDLAVDKAIELLKQAKYQTGDIYLLTDDMDSGQSRSIIERLKTTKYRLNIIGVGTTKGAPITLPNGQLLKQDNGDIIVPKLPFSSLVNLGNSLNGDTRLITLDDSDLRALAPQTLSFTNSREQASNQFGDRWHEAGPYLLLLLIPAAAMSFRRGLMGLILLVSIGVPFAPTPVYAATEPAKTEVDVSSSKPMSPKTSDWWNNLWHTNDQQGHVAYQAKDNQRAANKFDDKRWRATSLYQAGKYQEALDNFEGFNDADGYYNQGNALAHLEQYEQSLERFNKALALSPNNDAIKQNIEIVKQLQAQQQSQQNNQNGDSDDSQQSQDDDKQQDNQQDQESQQQQSENKGDQSQDEDGEQQPQKDQNESSDASDQQGEPTDDDKEAKKSTAAEHKKEQQLAKEQQQKAAKLNETFDPKNLTKEQLAHLNQLINKVNDDPSLLLKNKMAVEARKRQRQRISKKETKNW